MSTSSNVVKCRGLVTYNSELTMPEGSLRQAVNVNVDENGVITRRRGFNDYLGPTTGVETNAGITSQIMEYKDAIIRQYQSNLEFESSSEIFEEINGEYEQVRTGYRTKWQEANSNLYFTSASGIKKISETSNANLNVNMVEDAGVPRAGFIEGKVVTTVSGFLPPQSKVAYRFIFGTRDNENNLLLGTQSSRTIVTNFNSNEVVSEVSSITFTATSTSDELTDGDHFIFNTLDTKYCVYFDVTGTTSEPKTVETIGATYIRVQLTGVTSDNAVIAAVTANEIASEVLNVEVLISGSDTVTITSTEEGDITNVSTARNVSGGDISSRVSTQTTVEGSVTSGENANVEITGVIPSNIDTNYFYRVYRTSIISVVEGLTISDLDPGDEMNLIYEAAVTDAEVTAGEFTFTDITPESFRADAIPLYTNNTTGEGNTQSNDTPPIALDIELFRNYMFYANTKQKHRLELTSVSVDNFISGSSRLIIGNDEISRYYTFVGTSQEQSIVIDSLPSAGDYISIFSANDSRQYYIYFGDNTDDPQIAGASGYKVTVSDTPTSEEIAERIVVALEDNVDFTVSNSVNEIVFNYIDNGYTTGIINGVGTSIIINTATTLGMGELAATDEGGDVLLSASISVGQSIDETIRSLVKIVSKDPLSPVNAFYLSVGEELPGNFLLESRSIEDRPFYVAIEESSDTVIGEEFTPTISFANSIESITGNTGTTTINLTNHQYATGDEVFVSYFKDPSMSADPDSFSGVFSVTVIDVNSFTVDVATPDTVVSFVPSFSSVFSPSTVSENDAVPNRIYYSKLNEPEAVPFVNFIDVGPRDSEIKRILALRDDLYILKDDGIYVLSGTSAPDPRNLSGGWSVRLIDTTRIIAPDSAVVLNNQIYCLTEQGVVKVSGSSAAIISRGIEDRIDSVINKNTSFDINTFGIAYENDRCYILFMPESSSDSSAMQAFRYNVFERTWTRWTYEATCGHVLTRDNKLYLGNGDRNYISQERKCEDRTDHSDRNFTNIINTQGVRGTKIELSSIENVKKGDVLVQSQDITIYYIKYRLLKKMDLFDSNITGPSGASMFETFCPNIGDNLANSMQVINDYLVTLDPANVTTKVFTNADIKTLTDDLVDELNLATSITSIKSYKKPETVDYEAYIKDVDVVRNTVEVHIERPWIEGNLEVYKGYNTIVEWNPYHAGNPSVLKQVSYMTIMFDQNNFYDAIAKYASDASQATTSVNFTGKGIGYWGDMPWSDSNHYWGGVGNDIPYRGPVPRGKQKCRYISLTFEHFNARESFRILGFSAVIREISTRAYRGL